MEREGDDDSSSGQSMSLTTTSAHHFRDSDDVGFTLTILESMKEDYGLFVWPCSVILAEYVYQHRSRFSAANVLELGAGTSLPGLVAAKVGATVTLTDDSDRTEIDKVNDLSLRKYGSEYAVQFGTGLDDWLTELCDYEQEA